MVDWNLVEVNKARINDLLLDAVQERQIREARKASYSSFRRLVMWFGWRLVIWGTWLQQEEDYRPSARPGRPAWPA